MRLAGLTFGFLQVILKKPVCVLVTNPIVWILCEFVTAVELPHALARLLQAITPELGVSISLRSQPQRTSRIQGLPNVILKKSLHVGPEWTDSILEPRYCADH